MRRRASPPACGGPTRGGAVRPLQPHIGKQLVRSRKGPVELPGERRVHWAPSSFWGHRYALRDKGSRELLETSRGGFGKVRLTIQPDARGSEELPLLVLLSAIS